MNADQKRGPGRPREFDPSAALDKAVDLFWAHGYEGVDVNRIARAAGVTKPSLYRLFGDKSSLFLQTMRRYGETQGAKALAAFLAEPDVAKAIAVFLQTVVHGCTEAGRPTGCLFACVASGRAQHSRPVRIFYAQAFSELAEALTQRFMKESNAGHLSTQIPPDARARILVDIMQGLALRARAGVSRGDLLQDVKGYIPILIS